MKRILSLLLVILLLYTVIPAFAADPVPVESITITPGSASVPVKKSVMLKAAVEPRNASMKNLTWTSSDESVATVKGGQVTGVGSGTAVITAAAQDGSGVSATATITVVNPITKIVPEYHSLVLAPGIVWGLYWSVEPANADNRTVTWASSNTKVATVNDNGVIKALAAGNCVLTCAATDGSGVKASVNIQVKQHDIVITEPGTYDVDFETEDTKVSITLVVSGKPTTKKAERRFQTRNGCVTSPEDMVLQPVKAGSDTVSIVYLVKQKPEKTENHSVFVAPSAVGETAALDENGEPAPVRFLGIPWGSNYPQAKALLDNSGRGVKALSQRNDYLRAMYDGEVLFGNLTAFSAALNFSYTPGDRMFEARNSLYKGDFYFDPETPVDTLVQTVRSVYGLDEGKQTGDGYAWEREHVRLVLTQKSRFTILELIWDGTQEEQPEADGPAAESGEDGAEAGDTDGL